MQWSFWTNTKSDDMSLALAALQVVTRSQFEKLSVPSAFGLIQLAGCRMPCGSTLPMFLINAIGLRGGPGGHGLAQ